MVFLKKILVTTDLSDFSLAAMEYATSFGTLYTSRLYLLYVMDGREGSPRRRDASARRTRKRHAKASRNSSMPISPRKLV